jgi:hypothetical protein
MHAPDQSDRSTEADRAELEEVGDQGHEARPTTGPGLLGRCGRAVRVHVPSLYSSYIHRQVCA